MLTDPVVAFSADRVISNVVASQVNLGPDYVTITSNHIITALPFYARVEAAGSFTYVFNTGRQFNLKGSPSFRVINSWFFGGQYMFMHLFDIVETGRPSYIFQVIDITMGLNPYAVISEQVQSV